MASALMLMSWAFMLSSCHDDDSMNPASDDFTGAQSCVLIYCNPEDRANYEQTVNFAMEQIYAAQNGLSKKLKLTFRWVSTEEEHLAAAATNYLLSGKYAQVIGPDGDEWKAANTLISAASRCFSNVNKAPGIILPSVANIELVRTVSSMPYVASLTSDARGQLYSALREFKADADNSTHHVSLICTNDDYGKTYSRFWDQYAAAVGYDWVGQPSAFDGQRNGLIEISPDCSRRELETLIDDAMINVYLTTDDSVDVANIVVASSNPEHAAIVDSLLYDYKANQDLLEDYKLYVLNGEETMRHPERYHHLMAYVPSAAPYATNFNKTFKSRYGRYPVIGEAHIFDAVLMAFYAEYARLLQNESLDENETAISGGAALYAVLHNGYKSFGTFDSSWSSGDIKNVLNYYLEKEMPSISGVTSFWIFTNQDTPSMSADNYYSLHEVSSALSKDKVLTPLKWISSNSWEETYHVNADYESGGWDATQKKYESSNTGDGRTLPDVKDRWALLIAGTKAIDGNKWGANYRHQADVWNMYHLLRGHGYADNHIIVVTEDDIFGLGLYGESTNEKVVKRTQDADEPNLYEEIASHYKLSDLTQQDIVDILTGKKSSRLPHVIEAKETDNIFIYWSGHGHRDGYFRWDGQNDTNAKVKNAFTSDYMKSAINQLAGLAPDSDADTPAKYSYRRIMMVVETCYSGKFIRELPEFPSILYWSAAEGEESSYAEADNAIRITNLGLTVYRLDKYSSNFVNIVENVPTVSLTNLFYRLYDLTIDSHPVLYNAAKYGKLGHLEFTDYRTAD